MKKFPLVIAIMSLFAADALASINVDWESAGVLDHTATSAILNNYDVTWQLIYSVDTNMDPVDISNVAGGWVSGDDEVWATRIITDAYVADNTGNLWTESLTWDDGPGINFANPTFSAGNVYQRIYEVSGSVGVGTWYCQGAMATLSDWTSPSPPNESRFSSVVAPNQQITAIPEPATMSLLGLGALVMAMRRRRS